MKMDKTMEDALVEYQNLERQLQNVMLQKHQLQLQLNEINLAVEELGKTGEKEVYKSVGTIMVKTSKDEALKDLEDKKRLVEVKVNSLIKQEQSLKESLTESRGKLEGMMGQKKAE
ncbi:prefoldin subunit beta [Candidatus Micrarchaeota archaeon]|nr:prefoldin subunit beta [Candidatus Micrarchaeota archaeon]